MAYRYTASGVLEIEDRYVVKVSRILSSKDIRHDVNGSTITINHDERAATPARHKAEEAFEDLAPFIDRPQSIFVSSELLGESEIGFVGGRVRTDEVQTVWSTEGSPPTPDELVEALRQRGIAARVSKIQGSRKSGRRTRVFEIQPGSGGPGCKLTIKRRFWDSYDLLAVPEVYETLCRKYHLRPNQLRDALHSSKFGLEVRNPALGGASTDMLFENLLEVIEERTEGIRTNIG
ncbi:MAG: hypothetical protein KDD82_15675 [Planctomycetes bacterium]|nr:hypothetical protein [Planctomycetota bacterium]